MEGHEVFGTIKDYTDFISTNKIKSFSLFDDSVDSKIESLYVLVQSDTPIEEIYKELGYANIKDPAFVKLGKRLLKKLKLSLFFLDEKKSLFSSLGLSYYKLLRRCLQHRTILLLNKKIISFSDIEKDFRLADKLGFPEIVMQLAFPLRDHFGYVAPDLKKLNDLDAIIDKSIDSLNLENIVSKYYSKISYLYLYSNEEEEVLLKCLNDFKASIKDKRKENFTFKSWLKKFEIETLHLQLLKDYQGLVEHCKRSLQFYLDKDYKDFLSEFIITNELINAYINLENYDEALAKIKETEGVFPNGHLNWSKLKGLEYEIYIKQSNLDNAYKVVSEATNNIDSEVYASTHETWRIKEAYFHFLAELGAISQEIKEKYPKRGFRLNRFLNEVPQYSKEKRGLNISILIIQMLIYLQQEKYNAFIDRMDSLKQYSYRYLRNDEKLRSNCFIKMILKIPEAHYHPVAVQRHVKKYYDRMVKTPIPTSDQTTNIEVIPYEMLWKYTIILLEQIRK